MNKLDELNSIEKYRKQQKQQKIKRRLIVTAIILGLILIIFSADRIFKSLSSDSQLPTYDAAELSKGFPITMPTSATYRLNLMGDEVSLLTDTGLFVYNSSGNRIFNFSHAYNSAVSETSNTRTLVYDSGSTGFICATRKNVVYNKTVTDKIMFGRIADNGNVAIITDSDRYASVLYVFDKSGKEFYSLSATEKIINFAFLPDNNGFMLATVSAEGGEVYSKLSCYKFSNKEKEEWSARFNGSVIFEINAYSQNNATVVADNAIYAVKKGEIANTFSYTNKISDIALSDSISAVLLDDSATRQKRLISVNKDGNLLYDVTFESRAFDVSLSGSTVYTFDGRNIEKFETDGTKSASVTLESEYDYFTVNSNNIYLLSDTVIGRISVGEVKNTKDATSQNDTVSDTQTEAEVNEAEATATQEPQTEAQNEEEEQQ